MKLEEYVSTAEQRVLELKELLDEGHITKEEFIELAEDVADLSRVDEDLNLEENKVMAQKAFNVIKAIISTI